MAMRKGFTCGAFDLLHAGHVLIGSVCDYLSRTTDRPLPRQSNEQSVQSLEERKIQLSAVMFVDEIIIYETEKDLYNLLSKLQPDIRIL